ncbi:MAG TPA: hypothetical protein VMY37_31440 [Thermoguttaceae bacterium]|nr:hypothetical protein [Thermoguttaceae bacterium]
MSRRRKSSRPGRARPGPSAPQEHAPTARHAESPDPLSARPAREPNPPRPNKPLLVATGILLVAWIAVLISLAVAT